MSAQSAWTTRCGEADHVRHGETDLVPQRLYWRGTNRWSDLVTRPKVGIIGTRHGTPTGIAIAEEWAEALAAEGVVIVSGLARGIDGAAHRGALRADAPVLGVIGTGVDRSYPSNHRELHDQVAQAGALCSPFPNGTTPRAWHFPVRNGVLAAMIDVLVVIESPSRGGSLITVDHAASLGATVMAVPGSVRARTSAGTNRLIADGALACLGVEDIMTALSLDRAAPMPAQLPLLDQVQQRCLDTLSAVPMSWSDLCEVLVAEGYAIAAIATAVASLEQLGLVNGQGGALACT